MVRKFRTWRKDNDISDDDSHYDGEGGDHDGSDDEDGGGDGDGDGSSGDKNDCSDGKVDDDDGGGSSDNDGIDDEDNSDGTLKQGSLILRSWNSICRWPVKKWDVQQEVSGR